MSENLFKNASEKFIGSHTSYFDVCKLSGSLPFSAQNE